MIYYDVMVPAYVEVSDAARAALQAVGTVIESVSEPAAGNKTIRSLRIERVPADDALGAARAVAQALGQDVTDLVLVIPSAWME